VATDYSIGLSALPSQSAKVERPGHGTQRPGQADEQRWKRGSSAEDNERGGYSSAPEEVTKVKQVEQEE
jgi:hypothetical protein